ncbi:hypothetical protein D3C72_2005650 [compost metagenome]
MADSATKGSTGTRLAQITNASGSNPGLCCCARRDTMLDAAHMAAPHSVSSRPANVVAAATPMPDPGPT